MRIVVMLMVIAMTGGCAVCPSLTSGPRAYVPRLNDQTVSVIPAGPPVLATISVGFGVDLGPIAAAVTPDGSRAYVASPRTNTVSVIDTATNMVIAAVTVGNYPSAVAISPDGSWVYVVNQGSDSVSVIDVASGKVVLTVPVGKSPAGVAVNADGRVYVTSSGSDSVSVIYTQLFPSQVVSTKIGMGASSFGVAVHPDGTRVYVTHIVTSSVSVIDTTKNAVVQSVKVGNVPWGVAVHPAGTRVYVTNAGDDNISVIDTASNANIETIAVGKTPWRVAVAPSGDLYVTNYDSNTVSVIGTSFSSHKTIAVAKGPTGVAVAPKGNRVYVTHPGVFRENRAGLFGVSVLDAAWPWPECAATVPVGTWPAGVAVNSSGTRAYVVNYKSDNVSVIDTSVNQVLATVPVGKGPVAVDLNAYDTRAYVANFDDGSVSIIDIVNDKNQVVATMSAGTSPAQLSGVAVNVLDLLVYVPDSKNHQVWVFDTKTKQPVGVLTEAVGSEPSGVAVTPQRRAYVTDGFTKSVWVVREWGPPFPAPPPFVETTIPLNPGPTRILKASPDGSRVYVVTFGGIAVIDTQGNKVVATIPGPGAGIQGLAFSRDGSRLYAAESVGSGVWVIDAASNTVMGVVPIGTAPWGVATTP